MLTCTSRTLSAAALTLLVSSTLLNLTPASAEQTSEQMAPLASENESAVLEETDQLIISSDQSLQTVHTLVDQTLEAQVTESKEVAQDLDVKVIKLDESLDAQDQQQVIDSLEQVEGIDSVEPDYLIHNAAASLPANAGVSEPGWNALWHIRSIGANQVWPSFTGEGVVIGISDTGGPVRDVDVATVPGFDFTSLENGRDGTGWDNNPRDEGTWTSSATSSWHGLHVAGTAAASKNNYGVIGVAPEAKVQHVRSLGIGTNEYLSNITASWLWSAGIGVSGAPVNQSPAAVINASMSWPSTVCAPIVQNAINQLAAAKVPLVVAAGNNNQNAAAHSPGNCPGAITVGASSASGARAPYSNFGPTLDLYAPGGAGDGYIYSNFNTGSTVPAAASLAYNAGTSMAAPHVTGTIALMSQKNPDLSVEQIRSILTRTASTSSSGLKILNTKAAVDATPAAGPQVRGGIGAHYYANGGMQTFGNPLANEYASTLGGVIQHFSSNRSIYWSPERGAVSMWNPGAIGWAYRNASAERGYLGYPYGPEEARPGGAVQSFFNSSAGSLHHIYWSPSTGAQIINGNGGIYHRWVAGGHYNTYGYPISGELSQNGAAYQYFKKGNAETAMYWSEQYGPKVMNSKGAIFYHFRDKGFIDKYGYPTTDETWNGSYASVRFSKGYEIRWSPNGVWEVRL